MKFIAPALQGPERWGQDHQTIKINAILTKIYSFLLDIKQSSDGMIVISIELSTNIVMFMALGSGVLAIGWGSKDCIVKMH